MSPKRLREFSLVLSSKQEGAHWPGGEPKQVDGREFLVLAGVEDVRGADEAENGHEKIQEGV